MITYAQVKKAMFNPPPEPFVNLFNELGLAISQHPNCVNEKNPFDRLNESGNFCISATSIQSNYIAFVLGKHHRSSFPAEIMQLFFEIDSSFQIQYGKINGKDINGCIYLIHQGEEAYDLEQVYANIYS